MLTTFAYGFGWQEAAIVGGIVILLFGAQKLPQLARGFGEGIREFKKAVNNDETPTSENTDDEKKDK